MSERINELLDDLDAAVNARELSMHDLSTQRERNLAWQQYRDARYAIGIALAAAPRVEVTEEMVERAQREYRKQWEYEFCAIEEGAISADARKRVMRAALTAALTEGTRG